MTTLHPQAPAGDLAPAEEQDRSARLARGATGLLREANALGLLHAADVHVARRLGALGGEDDERVLLALALAVRAVRHGSVVLHLEQVPATVVPEDADDSGDVEAVEVTWPPPQEWLEAVRRSLLTTEHTAAGDGAAGPTTPLHLVGDALWLDRYWRQERAVAADLRARATGVAGYEAAAVGAVLDRLWPGAPADDQRAAAAVCLTHGVSVLGGGPGTGKTTTVARLLAALHALSDGVPRVALAAPTGKAAARLTEAVVSAAAEEVFTPAERRFLETTGASTLHRLLGIRPGSVRARFDAEHHLPHDVVIVDEASMVGLGVMARLLAALRPGARLVLVGDPQQLASVEVGAVLADLVAPGPAAPHGIALLTRTHRFSAGGRIAALADAVRRGAADEVVDLLRAGDAPGLEFFEVPDEEPVAGAALEAVRADVVGRTGALVGAARAGDAAAALEALEAHRVLCAHRHGGRGVSHWSALAQRWAVEEFGVSVRADGRYVGLPVIVTANDPAVGVFNGDTGVVLERDGVLVAALGRGEGPLVVPLARLAAVEPVHAMTVHRSQGSQFGAVTVLAAPARSPLATREMLYTALTRARERVRVVGSVDAVVAAVQRPLARATGLAERLRTPLP
ncbi:exodeoxyribonuclease V subunit alpha [Kineococcus sp. SYSU DK006]|uniref:exodeoxyribonuclease V subunit alpha n=1 Tax=Kineococcus sp. SYSU DK006 TaxID=3383127 RepID=UPI003D7C3DF0